MNWDYVCFFLFTVAFSRSVQHTAQHILIVNINLLKHQIVSAHKHMFACGTLQTPTYYLPGDNVGLSK